MTAHEKAIMPVTFRWQLTDRQCWVCASHALSPVLSSEHCFQFDWDHVQAKKAIAKEIVRWGNPLPPFFPLSSLCTTSMFSIGSFTPHSSHKGLAMTKSARWRNSSECVTRYLVCFLCDRSVCEDGDGEIDINELGEIMQSLGVAHSPKEIKTMFENLDVGACVSCLLPLLELFVDFLQTNRRLSIFTSFLVVCVGFRRFANILVTGHCSSFSYHLVSEDQSPVVNQKCTPSYSIISFLTSSVCFPSERNSVKWNEGLVQCHGCQWRWRALQERALPDLSRIRVSASFLFVCFLLYIA